MTNLKVLSAKSARTRRRAPSVLKVIALRMVLVSSVSWILARIVTKHQVNAISARLGSIWIILEDVSHAQLPVWNAAVQTFARNATPSSIN